MIVIQEYKPESINDSTKYWNSRLIKNVHKILSELERKFRNFGMSPYKENCEEFGTLEINFSKYIWTWFCDLQGFRSSVASDISKIISFYQVLWLEMKLSKQYSYAVSHTLVPTLFIHINGLLSPISAYDNVFHSRINLPASLNYFRCG